MDRFASAFVSGVVRHNGRSYVQLDASADSADGKSLIIWLEPTEGGAWAAARVYEKEASREIDWYDNPLHQAVTFGPGGEEPGLEGSSEGRLVERLLAEPGIHRRVEQVWNEQAK